MTQPTAEALPDSPLLSFILAALTSMIAPTLIDLRLAQRAAREAVAAYLARGETEWIAIGQIIAFALTALDTLRLSMPEDVPLSMKLKLRGNANAANRAARDATERLAKARRTPATPELVAQPAQAEPPSRHLTEQDWASGMQAVAARLQAEAAIASPERRKTNALWINVLTGVANEIGAAQNNPGTGKAALLRGTWMAGDPGIPPDLCHGGNAAAGNGAPSHRHGSACPIRGARIAVAKHPTPTCAGPDHQAGGMAPRLVAGVRPT